MVKIVKEQNILHYKYIDALRGIAILSVVITHVSQMIKNVPVLALKVAGAGAYGVQLFFIISSLTLFISYNQRKNIDGKNTNTFFYIRRFFRIAPTFYLAIIIYSVVLLLKNKILIGAFGILNLTNIFIFASFLSIFYPPAMFYLPFGGWTVAIEMVYYKFIPYLYKKINNLKQSIIFFAITLIGYKILEFVLNFLLKLPKKISEYILLFPQQLPVFALGIICYFLINNKKTKTKYLLTGSIIYIICVIFYGNKLIFIPENILISFGFAGLILAMSKEKFYILQNKFTEFIGKISYSIYLWHFFFVMIIWYFYKKLNYFGYPNFLISFIIILAITLLVTIPFSFLSYKIERVGIKLGNKIIYRINNKII